MLVLLSDVKAYLKISAGNTAFDAFLTEQITLVSEVIEAYCRRTFASASYVQTYYGSDYSYGSLFQTFHYPLISVASIVEDGILLDVSNYRIQKTTGTILRPDGYFFGGTSMDVTYTAGFATIPAAIRSVVFALVEERYNKKNSGVQLNFGSDVQRISIPGAISIDFDYSLNNNDRKAAFGVILGSQANVLDFYRSDRAILPNDRLVYL